MLTERLTGKKVIVDGEVNQDAERAIARDGYRVLDDNVKALVQTMRSQTMVGESPADVEAYVMDKLEEYETEIWNMSEPDFMLSLIDSVFEGVEEMMKRD